ncbi:MAG: hypothetical protein R2882_11030 [Gemmatimonadales bacterium]
MLSYQDRVDAGMMTGPRVYSTGPGVFSGDRVGSLDRARSVLKRYSEYYDTKTFKMYMSGNRQTRQYLIMAARELKLMPTTEGGLQFALNMTHAMDGYSGVEHTIPIYPMYDDVVQLLKTSGTVNTPTLVVSYGGPWAENYFYSREDNINDAKLRHFTPPEELDAKIRRRMAGPGPSGWVHDSELMFPEARRVQPPPRRGGRLRRRRQPRPAPWPGYHWELWAMQSGGMSNHDALQGGHALRRPGHRPGRDLGSSRRGKCFGRSDRARPRSARRHPQHQLGPVRDEERPALRGRHPERGLAPPARGGRRVLAASGAPEHLGDSVRRPMTYDNAMTNRLSRRVLSAATQALLLAAAPLAAQGPGGPGGAPPKPLPLEAKRSASFTATSGTWISVDVSPDGQTLVFDLLGDLYTMPITGGRATAITSGLAYDAQPRFSPDGKKVVFVSDRSGGDNLWTIELATGDTTQVTQGNSAQYISPDYSPDGKYLVASRGTGGFPTAKLQLYSVDGGTGLPIGPSGPQAAQLKMLGAAFSPDGRNIYFAARSGDWHYNALFPQYELGMYDRETGSVTQVTSRYGSAFRPAVSPDGKWLTYGTRWQTVTGLRIRNLETGAEDWLVSPIQRDDIESRGTLDVLPGYSFTPDSKAVIISYGGGLWRVGLDKSAPVRIPFSADVKAAVGPEVKFAYRVDTATTMTAKQIRNPVVSPDGKRLAFTAVDRLYVQDLPDGKPRRVSTADQGEYQPVWAPDGVTLAWISWGYAAGGQPPMKARVDGRTITPVQLTPHGGALHQPRVDAAGRPRLVATSAGGP